MNNILFTYQKTHRYFAQIHEDLEDLGKKEISSLGGSNIKAVYRGIYFDADKPSLYRIIYCSRFCSRILAQLLRFDCHSEKYLYRTAKKLDWSALLSSDGSFAVRSTVSHCKVTHSHYAALCLKDAIVDFFRERTGNRPSIDKVAPDLFINLHMENNKATISADLSGGSLHRRGYRRESGSAPMQETLAAAIIHLAGWNREKPLHDPMCGSGTLLAEALMHHARIPASFLRKDFGVKRLPDFDSIAWETMRAEIHNRIRIPREGLITGGDASADAIAMAAKNLSNLPGGKKVILRVSPFSGLKNLKNHVIICNPPYGRRLVPDKRMSKFMNEFGMFLKHSCHESTAFVYLGDKELTKHIGLKSSWRRPLKNGGLDGVLVRYDL